MKELLERVLTLTNGAILLLEQLDAAIDAHDYRKIGARMYELGRQLHVIREAISETKSRRGA